MDEFVGDRAEQGKAEFPSPSLDGVLRALSHPLRRRILRALAERPQSASALARDFGEEVSAIAYHLNQVLGRECHVVVLVETVARRGALEKIYALNPETWVALEASPELTDGAHEFFSLILGVPGFATVAEVS